MSLYSLALFLHVSGAIGTFVSLGIWLFGLAALRRARLVEQERALAWLIIIASPVMVLSVLLLALAGLEMALSRLWSLHWATACRRARSVSPAGHEVDPFLKQSRLDLAVVE